MKRTNRAVGGLGVSLLLSLVLGVAPAWAQPKEGPRPDEGKPKGEKAEGAGERGSVTQHEMTVGGRVLRYKATAGMLALKDDSGKPKADVFYVAYERLADAGGTPRARDVAVHRPFDPPHR